MTESPQRKRSDAALLASELRYRRLFESAKDGILILDAETGRVVDVNPFLVQLLGFSHDAFLGKQLWELGFFKDVVANQAHFAELQAKEYVRYEDLPLETADGRRVEVEFVSNVYLVNHHKVIQCNIRDNTAHNRAAKALRALSSRQEAILAAVPDIIMEVDAHKVYAWANQAGLDFFGDDVVGKEAAFYFEGEQPIYPSVQPLFDGHQDVIYVESWQRRKDGQKRLLAWWCRGLKDERGNVTGALSSAWDITERKLAEESIRQSEERFRLIMENLKDLVVVLDLDGRRLYNSPSYGNILGDPDSLRGSSSFDEIHPDDRERVRMAFRESVRTGVGQRLEYRLVDRAGQARHIESQGSLIRDDEGRVSKVLVVSRDVTERQRVEAALQASEAKYRRLHESMTDAFVATDMAGHIQESNPAFQTMVGYGDAELHQFTYQALTPEPWHAFEARIVAEQILPLGHSEVYEKEYRRRDGTLLPVELRTFLIRDDAGQPSGMWAIVRDITGRKRAEESLRTSEERYRQIVETAHEGIWCIDADSRGSFVNQRMEEMLGYPAREMLGRPLTDFLRPEDAADHALQFQARQHGQSGHFERRYRHANGGWRWMSISATPQVDAAGRFLGSFAMFTDITERKQTEAALQENAAFLNTLLESIPAPVFYKDTEGRYLGVNKAFETFYGKTRGELVGKSVFDIAPRDLAEVYHAKDLELLRNPGVQVYDTDMRDAQGRMHDVVIHKATFKDSGGKISGLLGVMLDITERKRAQADYAMLFEKMLDGFALHEMIFDAAGQPVDYRFLAVNPGFEHMTGLSAQSVLGKTIREVSPGIEPFWIETYGRVVMTGEPEFFEHFSRELDRHFEVSAFRPAPGQFACVLVDITERKRTEATLESERRLLNSLITTSPDHIYFKDLASRFIRINEAHAAALGLRDPGEAVGKGDFDFFGKAHGDQAYADEQQILTTGQPLINKQEREDWRDGRVTWVSTTKMPLRDGTGKIIGLMGISRDITAHKQAEAEALRYQAQLQAIYDNAPLMMCLVNEHSEVEQMNRAMAELSGPPPPDGTPRHPGDFLGCLNALDDPAGCGSGPHCGTCPLRLALLETFRTGRAKNRVETTLHLAHRGVRRELRLSASTALMRIAGEAKVLLCLEDITARKQLEQQFLQAQKMEAVGQLAGGVAHDFNNILAAIIMHLHLLQETPGLAAEVAGALKDVQGYAHRAADLTRQLLLFSRRKAVEPKRVDLNAVIEGMMKMLRRVLGEHIEMKFAAAPEGQWVDADPGMIEQVVMNLCVNARDAMPKGGRLKLSTATVEIGPEQAQREADARVGRFVCLTLGDTGCGMDEVTLKRIFEPFFTTKEVGKGTGLGLATVYGIVSQHQGWVSVESSVGAGTTFRVYLPRTAALETSFTKAGDSVMPRGHETILLVEDESSLLTLSATILRHCGYRVLEARNGIEALRVWEETGQQAHLVLTDMVMPGGISGFDLVERLRQSKPGLKVLLTSGYSLELTRQDSETRARFRFLAKPYQAITLAKAVREVLDEK